MAGRWYVAVDMKEMSPVTCKWLVTNTGLDHISNISTVQQNPFLSSSLDCLHCSAQNNISAEVHLDWLDSKYTTP